MNCTLSLQRSIRQLIVDYHVIRCELHLYQNRYRHLYAIIDNACQYYDTEEAVTDYVLNLFGFEPIRKIVSLHPIREITPDAVSKD